MPDKLLVTSSPHLRTRNDTAQLMRDVIVALIPALIAAVWVFGFRALVMTIVSAGACVFFEWGYRKLLKKSNDVTDYSAIVTGILIAFCVPVTLSVWMLIVGDFFAIVLVKQLFGGIGKNFMNPALAARAFLFSWPQSMNNWAAPKWYPNFFSLSTADAVTGATPLSFIGQGVLPESSSLFDVIIGNIGGSMGEISAIALIIGAGYLLWRRIIDWRVPASYLGTVAVITFLLPIGGLARADSVFWNLFSGGLILGAFFMATDYTTSPVNPAAKIIYGIGCGVITVAIRAKGGYPEGVTYGILVMNAVSALLDRYFPRKRFGETVRKFSVNFSGIAELKSAVKKILSN
ncbi:MAG: RnfABCDGE type electron transport complex subunit D, partial [Oscillospiraceae bacterium]|nr:RnfABCDGE type electron transport complex subunit D [Oscillospiraceae bacterium]